MRAWALALALALALLGSIAHADPVVSPTPCLRSDPDLPDGAVRIGAYDGDLGAGHSACLRSEFAVGARVGAILDTPHFYGALALDAQLRASRVFAHDRVEVFGTFNFVRYQYVQNATIKGSELGLGATTIGIAGMAFTNHLVVITPFARLLLPTELLAQTPTLGGELGVAIVVRPWARLAFHFVLSGDLTFGISRAPTDPHGGFLAVAGVEYAPKRWFALSFDLQAHFGNRAPLDYLAPALALRFRLYRQLALEVAAMAPLPRISADRHNALLLLQLVGKF